MQEQHLSHLSTESSKAAVESLIHCLDSLNRRPWQKLLRRSLHITSWAIAISLTVASPSKAASITYSGDTTGAPTFNRPAAPGFEGINNPITSLSSIGTAAAYFSQPFFVNQTGSYDVVGTQNFDSLQFLYQNSFNPASPLNNVLKGDDPFGETGIGKAGFISLPLIAGTQYFLVTTGFSNANDPTDVSFGKFTNTIQGPGNITLAAVPEPSSLPSIIAFSLFGGVLILKRKLAD